MARKTGKDKQPKERKSRDKGFTIVFKHVGLDEEAVLAVIRSMMYGMPLTETKKLAEQTCPGYPQTRGPVPGRKEGSVSPEEGSEDERLLP
jgi:hypothetical protein